MQITDDTIRELQMHIALMLPLGDGVRIVCRAEMCGKLRDQIRAMGMTYDDALMGADFIVTDNVADDEVHVLSPAMADALMELRSPGLSWKIIVKACTDSMER